MSVPTPSVFFDNNSCPPQRSLVLDYLCHSCYTGTARAFAHDSTVRHLDADGDEMIARREDEQDYTGVTDEDLKQVEIRRGIRDISPYLMYMSSRTRFISRPQKSRRIYSLAVSMQRGAFFRNTFQMCSRRRFGQMHLLNPALHQILSSRSFLFLWSLCSST